MIQHIEHLLIAHDCVIIPGVGAVLAHRATARMNQDVSVLHAPVRAFTFNPALNHNDGVLAASVARSEGISYESAVARVDAAAAEMLMQLENQYSLSLGRVGRLTRESDGSLRFSPGDGASISPSTMWLPAVDLSVFSESREESAISSGVIAPRGQHRMRRSRRMAARVVRMAALMALLVAVGLTLVTPLQVENPQLASLGIDYSATRRAGSGLMQIPGQAEAPVILVLERRADAATAVDTAAYNAMRLSARAANAVPKPRKNYCLVVASLASESEALKFIEAHGDSTLGILRRDGRYRVYAAEGATLAETVESGRKIADRYPDTWICRR